MWKLYPPVLPPAKSPTPFWAVRGVYCGVRLDKKSTGATTQDAAKRILKSWMQLAEKGEFAKAPAAAPLTFGRAARGYMGAETDEGYAGRAQYLDPIIRVWDDKLIHDIDQTAIDELAKQLYPTTKPATRNRQVYTPVSCVLKRALGKDAWAVKRPKGAGGDRTVWSFNQEQAFAVLDAADSLDAEFGLFCQFALYTGCRLAEILNLTIADVHLNEAKPCAWARRSKNGKARWVHLQPWLVAALANHPRSLARPANDRLFRFHKGGSFTRVMHAAIAQAGLSEAFPERQGFHLWCHTYATWFVKHNNATSFDLARTGRWSDASSANIYNHSCPTDEARKGDNLPVRPSRPQLTLVKTEAA